MKALPVTSRIIKSIYFDQKDGRLKIAFRNGEERHFVGVSEDAAMGITKAASPGQHYIDHIRPYFKRIA